MAIWLGELQINPIYEMSLVENFFLLRYQLKIANQIIYNLNLPVTINPNTLLLQTPAIVDGIEVIEDDPTKSINAITVNKITFSPPYIIKVPLTDQTTITIQVIPSTL